MPASTHALPSSAEWLDLVRRKVENLRFGQVYIVVHDHEVTQVECLEKTRLDHSRSSARDAIRE